MKETIPDVLYRLTYPARMRFDERGYLEPHNGETWIGRILFRGRVPMVTEDDWEVIACYFAINESVFLKLTIASNSVEGLKSGRHVYLSGAEFFGRIPREAITRVEWCGWDDGRPVVIQDFSL